MEDPDEPLVDDEPPSWRPSVRLADLLHGRTAWDDADEATRSWARLTIYQAAQTICAGKTRQDRAAMIAKVPAGLRGKVQDEVRRLWVLR